jgi:hypothetical protein
MSKILQLHKAVINQDRLTLAMSLGEVIPRLRQSAIIAGLQRSKNVSGIRSGLPFLVSQPSQ